MTAQISEILWFEGEKHAMCAEPLSEYFQLAGESPEFAEVNTACWRGYIGEWEIRDDRLYLIGLEAYLANGEEACLETIFPGFSERAFAHWYSGTIRVPEGKMVDYVHMGYESVYERDVFLDFKKGILVGKTTRTNGQAEDASAPGGYGVGGMTIFPRPNRPEDSE
jgi:hypothetical protein